MTEEIVELLKPVTVQIIATAKDGDFQQIGSGAVISAADGKVLVLTAGHNLHQIKKIDDEKNYVFGSASEPGFSGDRTLEVQNTKAHVVFLNKDAPPIVLPITRGWMMDGLDVAVALVEVPDNRMDETSFLCLALDTTPPEVGEKVYAFGYSEMETVSSEVSYETGYGKWIAKSEGAVLAKDVFVSNSPMSLIG